jgi:hypothetical protein
MYLYDTAPIDHVRQDSAAASPNRKLRRKHHAKFFSVVSGIRYLP